MILSKEEKLYHALTGIKSVLKDFGIELIKNEVLLKDGKKITINCYQEIEELIVNYINDGQPLKFEELKVDMCVWDVIDKIYLKIIGIDYSREYLKVSPCNQLYDFGIKIPVESYEFGMYFQENRFYKKQI